MEMPGIEPGAFHMQSERSTAELHPQFIGKRVNGITDANRCVMLGQMECAI